MDARAHLAGAGPGDLVAVSLPPGPAWMPLLEELWASGAAILPLDHRLRPAEVASIVDRARPGLVLDADGAATVRTEGARVAEDTGLVIATSGTSGIPRVVELSRGAVEAAVGGSAEALGIGASEPWLCCLSPAHVGGMLVLLRGALAGAPVEVHPRFDPEAVGTARADHVSLVPTMLYRLLEAGTDLARFRTILVGGAALTDTAAEAARARGANVVTTYGLTETCGGVVYDGRPVGAAGARLGPEGELHLAGPTVMRGYLGDPAATGTAFTLDGWLRTGDAGSIDDGVVTVHGRLDERIRTGAETVWPQEVEAALRDHPGIAEVAVAGRADPEWGEHVVAFVVPALVDRAPTLEELRDHAAELIARFKVPRELVLLPELPRTASGKLRRAELR